MRTISCFLVPREKYFGCSYFGTKYHNEPLGFWCLVGNKNTFSLLGMEYPGTNPCGIFVQINYFVPVFFFFLFPKYNYEIYEHRCM